MTPGEQRDSSHEHEHDHDTEVELEDLEPEAREADQVKGGRDQTKASGTAEPTT